MGLPPTRIVSSLFSWDVCAVCHRDWPNHAVPTAYTLETIDADLPPQPVCDHCVEQQDPELFQQLLAERRRFHAS